MAHSFCPRDTVVTIVSYYPAVWVQSDIGRRLPPYGDGGGLHSPVDGISVSHIKGHLRSDKELRLDDRIDTVSSGSLKGKGPTRYPSYESGSNVMNQIYVGNDSNLAVGDECHSQVKSFKAFDSRRVRHASLSHDLP